MKGNWDIINLLLMIIGEIIQEEENEFQSFGFIPGFQLDYFLFIFFKKYYREIIK